MAPLFKKWLNLSWNGEWSVRTFDLFAAEAKWACLNIIKCVLLLRCKAKNLAECVLESVPNTPLKERVLWIPMGGVDLWKVWHILIKVDPWGFQELGVVSQPWNHHMDSYPDMVSYPLSIVWMFLGFLPDHSMICQCTWIYWRSLFFLQKIVILQILKNK